MPTPLIDSTFYPAVRAAIDVSMDAAALPDAVLALPIYAPAAIQDVLARDPEAESRTGAALTRVQNAAVYFAAARAAGRTAVVESETFGDYRYQLAKRDWARVATDLRALAEAELAAVLSPTTATTAARPTLFAVAAGRRGA